MDYSSWRRERYEDVFFGIHDHFSGEDDPECSLCHEQTAAQTNGETNA